MRFKWKIPTALKEYYNLELQAYDQGIRSGNLLVAWRHLERAHILGQAYSMEHTKAHWVKFKFGFRIKSIREIMGQLPRLLIGGVKVIYR